MGNYMSCASSRVPSNAVKVVHMNGRIEEFQRRVKAGEIMLENAQQFVCHSNALHIGRRITPLSADEDLEMGNLYFLLPMHKLQSVVRGSDMASLAFRANSTAKRPSGKTASVLSVFGDSRIVSPKAIDKFGRDVDPKTRAEELAVPGIKLEEVPEVSMAFARHGLSRCRSWKPKLDTINEAALLKGSTN